MVIEGAYDGVTHDCVRVYLNSIRITLGQHAVYVQDLDWCVHRPRGDEVTVRAEGTWVAFVLSEQYFVRFDYLDSCSSLRLYADLRYSSHLMGCDVCSLVHCRFRSRWLGFCLILQVQTRSQCVLNSIQRTLYFCIARK